MLRQRRDVLRRELPGAARPLLRHAAFFASPLTNGDLSAPSGNNGRYLYGACGGFPAYSYNSTNYFVDVVYVPTTRR